MAEMEATWAHHSWNPWMGCDKVAPGCAHCYIHRNMTLADKQPWGAIYRTHRCWEDPFKWQARAEEDEVCDRVFSCSMSDFFHAKADEWREVALEIIKDTPNLAYFLLTKRPARILRSLPETWRDGWPNVWLGTSVSCKRDLVNVDVLRKVPVHPKAVRGLSIEPLIEDIADELDLTGIGWVAVGGESGKGREYTWKPWWDWRKELQVTDGRRLMRLEWAARIRDKVKAAGIPFHFKQVTAEWPATGMNALGQIWHEVPEPPLPLPWRKQPPLKPWHLWSEWELRNLDVYGWPKGRKK
jgi:protein gp37